MKKNIYISAFAAGCSLLFAAGGIAAEKKMGEGQQQMEQEKQKSQYAQQLVTPDKLHGMKIQNQQGEEIGSVDKVVLDSQNGQIAYVVVTSGGFWGVGGEKALIPWKAVKLQQMAQKGEAVMTVNVSREQLKNAPQHDIEEIMDRQQAEQIHQYYGVAPYWEEQEMQQMQQPEGMKEQMEQQPMQQKEKQERMQ